MLPAVVRPKVRTRILPDIAFHQSDEPICYFIPGGEPGIFGDHSEGARIMSASCAMNMEVKYRNIHPLGDDFTP